MLWLGWQGLEMPGVLQTAVLDLSYNPSVHKM